MSTPSMPAVQGSNPPLAAPRNTTSANTASSLARSASAIAPTASAPARTDESASARGQPVDAGELASAIEKVQDFTKTLANELKFNIDEDSGQMVVKIVDSATDEVIRQIPSEEMLEIAKALDQIQGLLIKQKA